MFDLLGIDVMLFIVPLVAFILGFCYTGNFQSTKTRSEEELISQEPEIFVMNKQIVKNLGFFTN